MSESTLAAPLKRRAFDVLDAANLLQMFRIAASSDSAKMVKYKAVHQITDKSFVGQTMNAVMPTTQPMAFCEMSLAVSVIVERSSPNPARSFKPATLDNNFLLQNACQLFNRKSGETFARLPEEPGREDDREFAGYADHDLAASGGIAAGSAKQ